MSTQTQATTQSQEDNYVDIAAMMANPEEVLKDLNPESDPFTRPRVAEGWYQGIVEYREKDAGKRWVRKDGKDQDGNPIWWYSTKITCKITKDGDGNVTQYEGSYVAPEYLGTVSTKLRKGGGSSVSGICLHAGAKVETFTHAGQAAKLEQVIQQALPIKFVVRHDLQFRHKEGEGSNAQYYDIASVQGTSNPAWPKNADGSLDYSPSIYAIFDPEKGYRAAEDGDDPSKFVEVKGMVNVVVTRFAPVVG